MKLITLLTFLLCITAFFISCEKEASFETSNPPDPTPPAGADSNYLDKIYVGDLAGTSTIPDTTTIITFYYDNQKRLDSFVIRDTDPSDILEKKHSFFYTGLDSLPYKSVFVEIEGSEISTEIHFNFYNSNQIKIKDSMIRFNTSGGYLRDTIVTTFSFNGSFRIAKSHDGYVDSMQLDANGNIVSSKGYSWNGLGLDLQTTSQFTYDNHKTPFQKTKAFRSYNNIPVGETLWYEYFSNNERNSQVEFYLGSHSRNMNFQNIYNTTGEGFIKKSVITYAGFPDKEVMQFTYKKL